MISDGISGFYGYVGAVLLTVRQKIRTRSHKQSSPVTAGLKCTYAASVIQQQLYSLMKYQDVTGFDEGFF